MRQARAERDLPLRGRPPSGQPPARVTRLQDPGAGIVIISSHPRVSMDGLDSSSSVRDGLGHGLARGEGQTLVRFRPLEKTKFSTFSTFPSYGEHKCNMVEGLFAFVIEDREKEKSRQHFRSLGHGTLLCKAEKSSKATYLNARRVYIGVSLFEMAWVGGSHAST